MKRIYLYTVSACLLLLSACSSDNDELPGVGNNSTPSAALRIEVSASDFTHAGGANTRATDSGNTTTFENGDRIGITVLDESKNILYNNIPYKYNKSGNNGGTWEFDKNNGEGKTALYYDKQAKTYLAYFPYSSKADGAEDEGKLKELFPPLPDQRKKEDYRASDLLLGKCDLSDGSQKTLNIAFEHAYSSLSFPSDSVKVKCTIAGDVEHSYSALVRDVSFTIGEEPLLPYLASDSTYRIVVSPAGSKTSVDCLFGVGGGRMYSKTMDFEGLDVNTLYTLTLSSNISLNIGYYGLEMARLGDFYCKKSESEGYLIPGDAPTDIITAHKDNCLGIVFWAGDVTGDNYGLLVKENNEVFSNGTHGLVVALEDLKNNNNIETMNWGPAESVQGWLNGNNDKLSFTLPNNFKISAEDKRQGYVNTLVLQEYAKASNKTVPPITALNGFETKGGGKYKAPSESSGWYWPSKYELQYVCSGEWGSTGATLKGNLENQFKKVVETGSFGDRYWSSTEHSNSNRYYNAWVVGFNPVYVSEDGIKANGTFRVRPLLAF